MTQNRLKLFLSSLSNSLKLQKNDRGDDGDDNFPTHFLGSTLLIYKELFLEGMIRVGQRRDRGPYIKKSGTEVGQNA